MPVFTRSSGYVFLISLTYFLLMLAALTQCPLQAQTTPHLRIESVRGVLGETVAVPFRILERSIQGETITLDGRFVLSNSSVVFPKEWQFPQGAQNLASRLTRVNDSTYTFVINCRRTSTPSATNNDTLAFLRCEILAGSDTLSSLRASALRYTDSRGSSVIADVSGFVFARILDASVPFVRFAQMQAGAPNPVGRGAATRWAYTIDAPSEVIFFIYNTSGEEVERIERKKERGSHIETWFPRANIAAGTYFVRFTSNSGDVIQRLVIE